MVTHSSAAVLSGLLASLRTHEPDVEIVVVDSASPEGSPLVPRAARLHALAENVGFGTACNEGVLAAVTSGSSPDVVCFLNPDVRLVGPSLSQLARELRSRECTGVATAPIVDSAGERVPSAWGPTSPARAAFFAAGLDLRRPRRVLGRFLGRGVSTSGATLASDDLLIDGHVLGGAMVVRSECWEELGGFDEDFFLYWEDADLCYRARELGWEVRVLPCTPIVHEAGTSSAGVNDDQRWQWYVEGADLFARKHLTERQRRSLLRALRWGRRVRRLRA